MIDKDMLEAMSHLIQPINDRLDKIDTRLGAVENDLGTVKDDIQSLKADNAEIREDLQAVKADTARMVTLEKKVDLLLEGQQGINDKFKQLDQVAEDVEEIKAKVTALEAVTKDNTSQIRELKIAK